MAWRQIDGGKWPYRVSDRGEVEVKKEGVWIPLSVFVHCGQPKIWMRDKNGAKQSVVVSRLVARAFIGPIGPDSCVRHKDRIKMNNTVENLEIVPKRESNRICGATYRRPVAKIAPDGEVLEVYGTLKEAAAKNYVSRAAVLRRCQRKLKDPFAFTGYSFKYDR